MVEVSTLESLRLENLPELLRSSGPCITIQLPPYRPGEQARSPAAVLKSDLQEAVRQLAELKFPEPAASELIEPLLELSKSPELLGGSHWGRAIYRTPCVFRQFQLAEPVEAKFTVAGTFQIRSILTEAHLPAEFYVLKISKKRVGLLRYTGHRMEPVALPKGVPETFEEALALDQPDHDLENRSVAGNSAAAMRRVRFGTGSGRETQASYLAEFYRKVDRGLHEFLNTRGAGLLLVGVDEDNAIYRSSSTYPKLMDKTIHGSPDGFLDEANLLREAYSITRSTLIEREAAELAQRKEQVAPARLATDLKTILPAAFEGRVGWFYFDDSAQTIDKFTVQGYQPWGKEDLPNLAAVQTILHGGQAFALPADRMPDGASAVAILRF
jgi:Bacterial archaeo-eukaryotic release factor family 3